MTIKKLIEILQEYSPDMKVKFANGHIIDEVEDVQPVADMGTNISSVCFYGSKSMWERI